MPTGRDSSTGSASARPAGLGSGHSRDEPRSLRGAAHALARTNQMSNYLRMQLDSQVRREQPAAEHVELAVETFRMLADVTRVRVLWALLDGELPVNEIAAVVGKPAASVSQHLAKLRLARLVCTRRQGTQVFYRLGNSHVRQLVEDAVFNAEHAGADLPQHHRADADVTALPVTSRRSVPRP
jgi:DNA-binding transcriptional ArsR family regulator